MAPMPEDMVETHLKTIIQLLYDLQSSTHGYQGPATQQVLAAKLQSLTASLSALSTSASAAGAAAAAAASTLGSTTSSTTNTTSAAATDLVPPEIIAYVEEGRNPDIYTREFVELVQRGNGFLKGKTEAWAGFAGVLAQEMEGMGMEVGLKVEADVDGGDMVGKVEKGGEGGKKVGL